MREPGAAPGLAKARQRRSELASELADTTRSTHFPELLDPELIGDVDVLDDAVLDDAVLDDARDEPQLAERGYSQPAYAEASNRAEGFSGPRFGAPRRGGARVPLANLEPPSSARFELTPSPVPRVSLEPATGAVDISLVPGPNVGLSYNLPTLAAQHALGRRQQRRPAAPAVTLPPTSNSTTEREPLVTADRVKDVRSSRREVVLGLMIGVGLSLLLAGVGRAYLREDVVADAEFVPEVLESVTLSARRESDVPAAPSVAEQLAAASNPAYSTPGVANPAAVNPTAVNPTAVNPTADSAPQHPRLANARLEPPKRARDRAPARAARERAASRRAPASGAEPPILELVKPFSEAPRERPPMSPAESAGLGLDLPL
jgi:hypothetical protein